MKKKGFESYFLSGSEGAKLEIMQMQGIPDNKNDVTKQNTGIIHIAFALESKEGVDLLTKAIQTDGHIVISKPRQTGDGYYESCILDPDGNRIEIIYK